MVVQSVSGWIVMGLIAGFGAGKLLDSRGQSAAMDILFGVVGAGAGGWSFFAIATSGAAGLDVGSLLAAVVGAAVFLLIGRTVRGSASRMCEVLGVLRPF